MGPSPSPCHPVKCYMGLRPTQDDEKRIGPATTLSLPLPSPCHPDQSVSGFPATQNSQHPRMRLSVKKGAPPLPKPTKSTGNPGERSGGICGSTDPSWIRGMLGALKGPDGVTPKASYGGYSVPVRFLPKIATAAPGYLSVPPQVQSFSPGFDTFPCESVSI